jgi:hypothetical protein
LPRACESIIRHKIAADESNQTIADYRNTFKKLQLSLRNNPPFAKITRGRLVAFFAWLQDSFTSEPVIAPFSKEAVAAPRAKPGRRRPVRRTTARAHCKIA